MERIHQLSNELQIKDRVPLFFFYIGLSIELLILIIDKSALVNPIEGRLFQLTFLLFFLKLICTKYSLREWICMVCFGIIGFVSYKVTGRNEILRLAVFICCMRDVDKRKVFQYIFYVTLAGCILIVALSFVGLLGDVIPEQNFRSSQDEMRYAFGMGHPNALHTMYLMLVLLFMYLYSERLKVWMYIVLFAGNLFLYLFTDSRTGMLMTTMAITMTCILGKIKKLQRMGFPYYLGMSVFLGCIGISVLGAYYSQEIWYRENWLKLDRMLSSRFLSLFYGSTSHAGTVETWSLFSSPDSTYYFDAGWVRLFYWYGIIPGIIFSLLLIGLFFYCRRTHNYMGLVMLVTLSIYTVMEAHIVSVYIARNYLLVLLAEYFAFFHIRQQGQELAAVEREYFYRCYRLLPRSTKRR